jgi:hypothetical protein
MIRQYLSSFVLLERAITGTRAHRGELMNETFACQVEEATWEAAG